MSGLNSLKTSAQPTSVYQIPEVGIGVFDYNFRVYGCNPQFRALLIITSGEPTGQLLDELFPNLQETDLYQVALQSEYFVFQAGLNQLEFSFFYNADHEFTGGTLSIKEAEPEKNEQVLLRSTRTKGLSGWAKESLLLTKRYRPSRYILEIVNNQLQKEVKQHEIVKINQAQDGPNLADTQFLLQQVADAIPDTLYLLDLKEKRTLYVNRNTANTLGYTPLELNQMGVSLIDLLLHSDDQKKIAAWEERLMRAKDNEVIETEYRNQHKNGEWRWINTRERVFKRDAEGKPLQVIGLAQDVSDKKEAMHELRSKTRLLNGILSHLPIAVWRIDTEGKIREAVGAGLKLKIEGTKELKGENYFQLFPKLKDELKQVLAGKTRSFLAQSDINGEKNFKQNYFYYDAESRQAVGFCLDITELKRTQEQLKAQADFTQNLIDNSIDGIFAFDQEGRINAWNRVMEERYTLAKEQATGKTLQDVTTLLELFQEADAYLQVLNGQTIQYRNKPCRLWNGYLDVIVLPIFGDEKKVTGGIAFLHDVTGRVKLEQERTRLKLRRQKEILNAILETQEEERRRIAESLHNGVGQILYATKLSLEVLQSQLAMGGSKVKALSGQISGLLEEAIIETRAVSFELVPVILRDFGLERALLELKQKLSQAPFDLYFHFVGLEKPLKKEYETAIYRIIQELLNNVIKHAEATEVHVHLIKSGRKIMITVEDNGRGFNQNNPEILLNGIGLSSIKNRVKLFNGTLDINSRPGQGTIVEIDLKLI